MTYTDYFNFTHKHGEISMDEFIADALRTDLNFPDSRSELEYLRSARITLINEIFTCYEFIKEHNLLSVYHSYRDGDQPY